MPQEQYTKLLQPGCAETAVTSCAKAIPGAFIRALARTALWKPSYGLIILIDLVPGLVYPQLLQEEVHLENCRAAWWSLKGSEVHHRSAAWSTSSSAAQDCDPLHTWRRLSAASAQLPHVRLPFAAMFGQAADFAKAPGSSLKASKAPNVA